MPVVTIKRLRYFTGQFLEALDFQSEQAYHITMRQRAHEAFYNAGVLDAGLQISAVSGDPTRISIAPGLAVDGQGRHIVIASDRVVSLPAATQAAQAYYVTLGYAEEEGDQQTPDTDVGDNTRIEEKPVVGFAAQLNTVNTRVSVVIARVTVGVDGRLSGAVDTSVRQVASARVPGAFGVGTAQPAQALHVLAPAATALIESTSDVAALRLVSNQGVNNRVELFNRSGGRLALATGGAGDALNVTRDGQVGVGTTTPMPNARMQLVNGAMLVTAATDSVQRADAALQIVGTAGGFDRLTQMSPIGAAKPGLNLLASRGASGNDQWWSWGVTTDDKWRILKGTAFGGEEGLTFTSTGSLGVGTTNPNARLHVQGNGALLNMVGTDTAFIQWYPKGSATRKGWIGYGEASGEAMTIRNDGGRMHVYGTELLYLLNKDGVVVSKAWSGNGNLTVEGDATVNGRVTGGSLNAVSNAGVLNLVGSDHAYMQWYPNGWSQRKGWIGYGGPGTTEMGIFNDVGHLTLGGAGTLQLRNQGGVTASGNLTVNGLIYGSLNSLNTNEGDVFAYVRAHDLCFGHSARHGGQAWTGRALVDSTDTLEINYARDWAKVKINGSVSTPSSRSLKDGIEPLSSQEAAGIVEGLKPMSFHFKGDEKQERCLGFIAEDVPAQVGTAERDAILNNHIVAALVQVVKDQQQAIADLSERLAHLEARRA